MERRDKIILPDYFPEKPWACRCGCGFDRVDPRLVERLNQARHLAGVPFRVNSCCRCREWNVNVGGSPGSAHLSGEAADIATTDGHHRFQVLSGLLAAGFRRVGIAKAYIHADVAGNLPAPAVWIY